MRFLLALTLLVAAAADRVRYDDYSLYRLLPTSEQQLAELKKLQLSDLHYSFWREPMQPNVGVDILVPPFKIHEFEKFVSINELESSILIENVQRLIDAEERAVRPKEFGWTTYYPLQDINDWLRSLVEQYPGIVTRVEGGVSYEGRFIEGVKVSFSQGKKAIIVEAGVHPRETICPAAVTWVLNEFLTSTDPVVRETAESYDWYFFPIFNPDGYDFTFTTDRFWRKTRSPVSDICYGVDPNRNWPYKWNPDEGASGEPCSEGYAGPYAWSEIETLTFAGTISAMMPAVQIYLSVHCFGQLVMTPYDFEPYPRPPNWLKLMEIANMMVDSMGSRYGMNYTAGNGADIYFPASGTVADYFMAMLNLSIVYTYELRDFGEYGFLLPGEQIVPQAQEVLDSLVVLVREAKQWLGNTL